MTLDWTGEEESSSPAPFGRTVLDNGVRVLIRPSSALSIVAVDCWLEVGALHEDEAHEGISHFLEHMFFKGSGRYPLGAMDRRVKEMGGYNNAATSMEYTHYYIVAPKEEWITALDLLADHLVDPVFPASEIERERGVVKEEIRRRNDAPDARLYTALSKAAFGASPYAREILGTSRSLDRIDRDVLLEWWRERYTAGRLIVVVAGDVDANEAHEAVASRLAGLRTGRGEPVSPAPPAIEPVAVEESMEVGRGYLAWMFPTGGRLDLEETCALEVGATILGDGMTSRLVRRLIDETRLVTAIGAWTYGFRPVGMLGIDAVLSPDRRARVEEEIAGVLTAVAREGTTPEEVERARVRLLADFAYDNETNAGIAGTLGEFEVLYGAADAYRAVLEGIASTTAERVTAVLADRVAPERAVRAWVGPDAAGA